MDPSGKRIAFLATDMVEQVELTEPWKALEEAGATPELIEFTVDVVFAEASPEEYGGLALPGGVGNRCHGRWTLVETDVIRGGTLTSYPSVKTDIRNAGGNWVDQEVVVDGNLVSSRKPDDLPAFCAAFVEQLARAPVVS